MKPYYEDKQVTIYHGDCREILPSLGRADAMITDPVWPNCPQGLLEGWENPQRLFKEMLKACPKLPRRLVVILRCDSDPRFLQAIPRRMKFVRNQTLTYRVPGYIGRVLGGDEMAYCYGEPIPSAPGRRVIPGRGPSVNHADRAPNGHPCSRPLIHMKWLVDWWSVSGETVIDPFCGSGTTLVAAKGANRKAIGIEFEERYCEIAAARLNQGTLDLVG